MSHRITHSTRRNNPVDASLFSDFWHEDSKRSWCFISRRCLNLIRRVHDLRQPNFVQWRLLFFGPRYETRLGVIVRRLEFWGSLYVCVCVCVCIYIYIYIYFKSCAPLLRLHAIYDKLLSNESERTLKWSWPNRGTIHTLARSD